MVIKPGHGTTDERLMTKTRKRTSRVRRSDVQICGFRARIEAHLNRKWPTFDQAQLYVNLGTADTCRLSRSGASPCGKGNRY
jgi:hypothetical protein